MGSVAVMPLKERQKGLAISAARVCRTERKLIHRGECCMHFESVY